MKRIFDWLREQCKDRSEVCYRSYLKLKSDEDYGCSFAYAHAVDLINEAEAKWNGGWIPCEVELPPMPKENPLFENKPLELYLTTIKGADYPFRAFWNGKYFTDGWGEVEAIAWMPLPPKYEPKGE